MTPELILSIASLGLSTITSILTVIINAKVGKLNNLEAEHKYKKHITKFELSFKDEDWLFNLMTSDEFHNYDIKSRRLIYKWWLEYSRTYLPAKLKVMLPNSRDFNGIVSPCPEPIPVSVEEYCNKKEDYK
jgi:hypothetical protein